MKKVCTIIFVLIVAVVIAFFLRGFRVCNDN